MWTTLVDPVVVNGSLMYLATVYHEDMVIDNQRDHVMLVGSIDLYNNWEQFEQQQLVKQWLVSVPMSTNIVHALLVGSK